VAKKNQTYKSALKEQDGITPPESLSSNSAKTIKANRKRKPSTEALVSGIISGDISALSRAITLVESTNTSHTKKANTIIAACLPYANTSIRIGITGVPGVGKSTFIEAFGSHLTSLGKKVAVLAVDPSSSLSKGSILGDKTRMEDLVKDKNAFIRPSPSGDSLGVKAAKLAKVEFNRALHLYPQKESNWSPKVSLCSALKQEGISEIWEMIANYKSVTMSNNYFEVNRNNQNKFWLLQTIEERLKSNFYNSTKIKTELQSQINLIEAGKTTPFAAADYLLSL